MPLLTRGAISVTPLLIRSALSLDEIADAMAENKPSPLDLVPGWGSLTDDPDIIGMLANRFNTDVGHPRIQPQDDLLPERLEARLYWWELDKSALRYEGYESKHDAMRANAVDIVLTAGDAGEIVSFVSTKNVPHISNDIVPQLEHISSLPSSSKSSNATAAAYDDVDPDFFFWLVFRALNDPAISSNLQIIELREAHSEDHAHRGTRLSQGVDPSRGEFLALLAQSTTEFGPVKITIGSQSPDAVIDCELDFYRKFSLIRGRSEFEGAPEGATPEQVNVLLAMQLANNTFPDLIEAWRADSAWTPEARQSYRDRSRTELSDALLRGGL